MNIPDKLLEAIAQIPIAIDELRAQNEAGLAEYHNAARLRGARYVTAGRPLVWGGPGRLVGWSLRASGGPVLLTLHDGHDTSGDVLATVNLATDGATSNLSFPGGVSFVESLYVETDTSSTGTLIGAWWLGAVD